MVLLFETLTASVSLKLNEGDLLNDLYVLLPLVLTFHVAVSID